MNMRMPDINDDSRLWDRADSEEAAWLRRVEDHCDYLMAECKDADKAEVINSDNDLYDGKLLANMMAAVANWTGSTDSAVEQIRKLHNLLADAMQDIAKEVTK